MYISIKRHSWFFKSWWYLLYFGHVQTRTAGKCWLQKTPFCLKLSAHAQWRQKTPFCLQLSTHAQKSVLSWSISMSRILDITVMYTLLEWKWVRESIFDYQILLLIFFFFLTEMVKKHFFGKKKILDRPQKHFKIRMLKLLKIMLRQNSRRDFFFFLFRRYCWNFDQKVP